MVSAELPQRRRSGQALIVKGKRSSNSFQQEGTQFHGWGIGTQQSASLKTGQRGRSFSSNWKREKDEGVSTAPSAPFTLPKKRTSATSCLREGKRSFRRNKATDTNAHKVSSCGTKGGGKRDWFWHFTTNKTLPNGGGEGKSSVNWRDNKERRRPWGRSGYYFRGRNRRGEGMAARTNKAILPLQNQLGKNCHLKKSLQPRRKRQNAGPVAQADRGKRGKKNLCSGGGGGGNFPRKKKNKDILILDG